MEILTINKMPFFTNKFSPKKIPIRKCESSIVSRELGSDYASKELGLEISQIRISLSTIDAVFDNGRWLSESRISGLPDEKAKRRKAVEEENNLLKLKVEILLDMLTQTTIESQYQLKKAEQLKHLKDYD